MTHNSGQLQKMLLAGTARVPFSADALAPELAALALPGMTAERQLWLASAAQRLWRRAGYTPPQVSAAAAAASANAAPAERMAPCPPAADAMLKRLLRGEEAPSLLREWLRLLNARRARLPERFLPNLLERASAEPELRPAVHAALGMRGRWLARHEPAWSWANAASEPNETTEPSALLDAWHNGAPAERVAALQAWRRIDPLVARAALQSCWAAEPPEQRIAFLPCLDINLQADDEPFLEAALDDRRKGVRVAAQGLLARLPGSALSQRMHARAAALLQIEQHPVHGARISVTLPDACDAAMARDGVGETKYPGQGEKAGWLVDVLAAIEPTHWLATSGLSPEACIALAMNTDYRQALLLGWTGGLQLHLRRAPSPALLAWLAAWTRVWLAADSTARYQSTAGLTGAYAVLPPAHLHTALLELVEQSGMPWQAADAPVTDLLEQLARKSDAPWPAPLSHAIAQRLLGAFPAMPNHQWAYRTLLSALAPVLDPSAVLAAERTWPGLGPDPHGWQGPLDEFFHVVRFRHEMILSFQESA